MKFRTVIRAIVILALSAPPIAASCLIPSATLDASTCGTHAVPGTPFNIYLLATLFGDAATPGVTGAEFRLQGQDPAWLPIVTANPASSIAFGSPVLLGCNIAFPTCQVGAGLRSVVLLYTVQFIALGAITPTTLHIEAHGLPSNSNFPCPLVTLCDDPVFTKLCVPGGFECVNNEVFCCGDPVAPATWSQVKGLYRSEP